MKEGLLFTGCMLEIIKIIIGHFLLKIYFYIIDMFVKLSKKDEIFNLGLLVYLIYKNKL